MKTNRLIFSLIVGLPLAAGAIITASAATSHPLQHMQSPAAQRFAHPLREKLRPIAMTALRHILNARAEAPLSADQKEQVHAILKNHQAEIQHQLEASRDARRAMRDTVAHTGAESPASREAAEMVGAAARDRALLVARLGSAVRPVLTTEQVQRWDAAREQIEAAFDAAISSMAQ